GASPTGTRTAAMPLPLSGRGRGIRHRSGASGPSALSAASAGSAPRRSAGSARSAASPAPPPRSARRSSPGAASTTAAQGQGLGATEEPGRAFGQEAFADVDTPASSRTVRGTSVTGRRIAGMTVPGFALVVLVVIAIIAAVLGGLGMLPFGAAGPLPEMGIAGP